MTAGDINNDGLLVKMSLVQWFDFLVRGVDTEVEALKAKQASSQVMSCATKSYVELHNNTYVQCHEMLKKMQAYKFDEARVIVVGVYMPVYQFLAML